MDRRQKRLEERTVEQRAALRSPVVYHVVRRQGEEELQRPVFSLWWSGVAAGLALFASVVGQGALELNLEGTAARSAIAPLGYTVGFLIVILGRMQLFTENTITTVLPVLADFTRQRLYCTARLWIVVFAANMVGALLAAAVTVHLPVSSPELVDACVRVAHRFAEKGAVDALFQGIPAGFAIAAVVWCRPTAERAEFWVILAFTYLIAIGEFSHVVVGAGEAFLLAVAGELPVLQAVFGLILPAFVGNVIGGTVLFALLAYAQVKEEMV